MSYDHYKKLLNEPPKKRVALTSSKKYKTYFPLIGDVCYRFKRQALEQFFADSIACRVFLALCPYLNYLTNSYKRDEQEEM